MTDTRTPEQRRRIMQSVGIADTGPELTVRRILFREGYRYRVHPKTLPGKPDMAFTKRKKAIFVHGCFWHGHGCEKGKLPKSKLDYWHPKIESNRLRDHQKKLELEKLGWADLEVWQCELKDAVSLRGKLLGFLGPAK